MQVGRIRPSFKCQAPGNSCKDSGMGILRGVFVVINLVRDNSRNSVILCSLQKVETKMANKRPYSGLVIEPPEKIKVLRQLKTMLDEDGKNDMDDLVAFRKGVLDLLELVDTKIRSEEFRKAGACPRQTPTTPKALLKEKVLLDVMSFLGTKDLLNCRLVSSSWCSLASNQLISTRIMRLTATSFGNHPGVRTTDFLRDIRRVNRLFPFSKFQIETTAYFTNLLKNFLIFYSGFIKFLHLKYHRSLHYSNQNEIEIKQVLRLINIPNCEHLIFTDFPCELLKSFNLEIPILRHLTKLEVHMKYDGRLANYFSSNSYYGKLIKSCKSLNTLGIFIKLTSKVESGDILQNVIDAINTAELKTLEHLELHWTDELHQKERDKLSAIADLTQLLPSQFKLKSLKLTDINCELLPKFLQFHSTIEHLDINFSSSFTAKNSTLNLIKVHKDLAKITKLSIPGLLNESECKEILALFMQEKFPELDNLTITHFSENFYKKDWPGFNSTVKTLNLEFDGNYHRIQKMVELLDAFAYTEKLTLRFADQHILRGLWKSELREKITELVLIDEAKQSRVTYSLDSIITGFDVMDCKTIAISEINRLTFFDMSTFNLNHWKDICTRISSSDTIANFHNLKKVKIFFPKGHITEVSLVYMLLTLNNLTSLCIKYSSIRKYFMANIRNSLPLTLNLDIETYD